MRILVCGSRNSADAQYIFATLDWYHLLHPITRLIHGGATGVDTVGGAWAASRSIPVSVYHAAWPQHGRKAGPMRNEKMLTHGKPDLIVAFAGGRGTADMLRRAARHNIPIVRQP